MYLATCVNPMVTTPGMLTFSHDSLRVLASPRGGAPYCESPELPCFQVKGVEETLVLFSTMSFQCLSSVAYIYLSLSWSILMDIPNYYV